jgi:hypothetical protein
MLFYHLAQKSIPKGINPFYAMIIAYVVGIILLTVCALMLPGNKSFVSSLTESNWAVLVVGAAAACIELGFLLAYRSGWKISLAASFGGTPNFPGQRFAGRLANDPLGQLTLRETILVEGESAQKVMRWEDYTQTAMDPSDDCTIWYVGDYLKKGQANYSSRIGAFRLPGCKPR